MLALSIATLLGRRPPAEVPAGFSPSELFANSEVGVWYDPSDFSTLYQDTSGTTPVTAVEQPVGLMLDKSQGLVLGSELVANPGNPYAVTTGYTAVNGSFSIVDGYLRFTESGVSTISRFFFSFTAEIGSYYKIEIRARSSSPSARLFNSSGLSPAILQDAGAITGSFQTFAFIVRATLGAPQILAYISTSATSGSNTIDFEFASVKKLPGNHAVAANNGTARPVLKSTGGLYYLAFTTDDAMSTASIDFSGTDEMSVFAGLTKNSDAAFGILVELSADPNSNGGSFFLSAPNDVTHEFGSLSRGTQFIDPNQNTRIDNAAYAAPFTCVATSLHDISDDLTTTRINGTVAGTATGDKGTGNFGNYPLYIGARNNASGFFNGSLYSLIVRGKTSTAQEIDDTEAWVANKTGVTL